MKERKYLNTQIETYGDKDATATVLELIEEETEIKWGNGSPPTENTTCCHCLLVHYAGINNKVILDYSEGEFHDYQQITSEELRNKGIEILKNPKYKEENLIKNLIGGNIMKSICNQLDNYLVQGENISLTPTGLSFNDKTYSQENNSMINTKGTDIISDIPVGITVPTPLEEVESGDIILTSEDEYLKVQVVNEAQLTALSYSTQQIKAVTPNLDILGNKSYKKLVTPFTYDGGINPALNVFTTIFNSYQNNNLENLLEENKHLITSKLSKFNFKDMVESNIFKTVLPLGLVGYELLELNLHKLSFKEIKQKIKDLDKKTFVLLLLGISFLIYTNQDKIKKIIAKMKIKLELKKIKNKFIDAKNTVKNLFIKE